MLARSCGVIILNFEVSHVPLVVPLDLLSSLS